MIRILFITCLSIFFLIQSAAAKSYAFKDIPANLLTDANAVIRNEEVTLKITPPAKQLIQKKIAITLLNKNAAEYGLIMLAYDANSKAKIKSAHLYDASGEKIKSMKQSDIFERSSLTNNHEAMEFNDGKLLIFSFDYNKYPFTIEYEIETESSQTMNLFGWAPISSLGLSSEKSSFQILTPNGFDIRLSHPPSLTPTITKEKNTVYTWQCDNIQAMRLCAFVPTTDTIFPHVEVAPNVFSVEKYSGSLKNWQDFSSFFYKLNIGRSELDLNEKDNINQISNQYKTTQEKVAALYKYMQQKTRYVSVQLGIGGIQPYMATFVSEKGYGDCKALTNYMHAILQAANIKSYYTLVQATPAGVKNIDPNFSKDYFNHVILTVPNSTDTIWLECTSQTNSAGYLGQFTANRKALIIDSEHGGLIPTQQIKYYHNIKSNNCNAHIDSTGNYNLSTKTTYCAFRQEALHHKIHSWSDTKLKKELEENMPIKFFKIDELRHEIIEGRIPAIYQFLKLHTTNSTTIPKNRIFIDPALISVKNFPRLEEEGERQIPFQFPYGGIDIDTVHITFDSSFRIESLPRNEKLVTDFGTYETSIIIDEQNQHKIVYTRKFVFFDNIYPKERWTEFATFIRQMNTYNDQKIILVKK